MGFKDLFYKSDVEIDEPISPKSSVKKPATISNIKPLPQLSTSALPPVSSYNDSSPIMNLSGDDTKKFEEYFKELFKNSNAPGLDYFEFVQTLERLKNNVSIDERNKFTTIFASFSTQDITANDLIVSAKRYRSIFEEKYHGIIESLKNKFDTKIKNNTATIESLTKENEELTKKREANIQKINSLQSETVSDNASWKKQEDSCNLVYSRVVQELDDTVNKISLYLTESKTV